MGLLKKKFQHDNMTSLISFLQTECPAIEAFVEEIEFSASGDEDNVNSKIDNYVSRYPELTNYFSTENLNRSDESKQSLSWCRSIRLAILDHLTVFDIDIPLLLNMIESYRYEAEIEELVELVRALDILGAEERFSEYEAILLKKLRKTGVDEFELERRYGDRLPIRLFNKRALHN
jgi:hypothetical protein